MTDELVWWIAKPKADFQFPRGWYHRENAYPGRLFTGPRNERYIRIYRDREAFFANDESWEASLPVPLPWFEPADLEA